MASDAAAGVVGAVVNPFKHENNASASCSGVAATAPLPLDAIVAVWCWQLASGETVCGGIGPFQNRD